MRELRTQLGGSFFNRVSRAGLCDRQPPRLWQSSECFRKLRNGDLASVTAAAAETKTMPGDFRVSITDVPGNNSYPIASFSWLLIPEELTDPAKRQALVEFVRSVLTEEQAQAEGVLTLLCRRECAKWS